MRYIDCNESSWQVELWIHGKVVRYSARAAAKIVVDETDKQRKERQS